jgi:LemA protein
MQEAWSIIDVFLKKRYELVPMLVNTVKGYAVYEQKLLENIVGLRTEAMLASDTKEKVMSENRFGQTADHLFLNIEKYPQLKADNHFLKLQHELSELENDLEKARRYYNGTVRENNIYQESFPPNLIASSLGFSKGVFFTTNGEKLAING